MCRAGLAHCHGSLFPLEAAGAAEGRREGVGGRGGDRCTVNRLGQYTRDTKEGEREREWRENGGDRFTGNRYGQYRSNKGVREEEACVYK